MKTKQRFDPKDNFLPIFNVILKTSVAFLHAIVLDSLTGGHLLPESGSFRPWVVSAWVVSAQFGGGSFRPR